MTGLVDRIKEPLSTLDKRIVTVVGAFFVISFALVNYNTIRDTLSGCVEPGSYAPVGPASAGGEEVGTDTIVGGNTVWMCPHGEPSRAELLASLATKVPGVAFSGIALLLLCRFLWTAVRPGLHSPAAPGRLTLLGWFVLVAGPISEAVQYYYTYELAGHLFRNTAEFRAHTPGVTADFNGQFSAWSQELQAHFPWWCVFAGVSALVVAKLLRIEVRMAEDLEGTI
jgi:hypothetical protein